MIATIEAEWSKTWSLRSSWATLGASVVLILVTAFSLANDFLHDLATATPSSTSMAPVDALVPAVQLGQTVLVAFVMIAMTSEYATGAIRTTFLAEPRRGRVLAAKAVTSAGAATVAAFASSIAGLIIIELILGDHAEPLGTDRWVISLRVAAVVAATSVLVTAVGAIVRHAVGTFALSLVLLVGLLALPPSSSVWTPAGGAAEFMLWTDTTYPPITGLGVVVAWTIVTYAAGLWLLRRRDA